MKFMKKKGFIKVRKALATAYYEKEKAEVGELWQLRVMRHIRSLGPLYSKPRSLEPFQRFVWRLVPVACVLVLLLGVALSQLDFVSDYELAKMFTEDPADFGLIDL